MEIDDVESEDVTEIWGEIEKIKDKDPELYEEVIERGVDVFRRLANGEAEDVKKELESKSGAEALQAIQGSYKNILEDEKSANDFLETMGKVGMKVAEIGLKLVL